MLLVDMPIELEVLLPWMSDGVEHRQINLRDRHLGDCHQFLFVVALDGQTMEGKYLGEHEQAHAGTTWVLRKRPN